MKYSIRISKVASKELQTVPVKIFNQITKAIYALENNPRPPGYKKLKGSGLSYSYWGLQSTLSDR